MNIMKTVKWKRVKKEKLRRWGAKEREWTWRSYKEKEKRVKWKKETRKRKIEKKKVEKRWKKRTKLKEDAAKWMEIDGKDGESGKRTMKRKCFKIRVERRAKGMDEKNRRIRNMGKE